MEMKLLVMTHKTNFGSVLYYSRNVSSREKKILESVKYTSYTPDKENIIEVTKESSHIYFITFIGGQDEFGRDYQSVISAIFPFKLSEDDFQKLSEVFEDVSNDMELEDFSLREKYFIDVLGVKREWKGLRKSKHKVVKVNLARVLLVFIGVLVLLGSAVFLMIRESDRIVNGAEKIVAKFQNEELKAYKNLKKNIEKEPSYKKKYNMYMTFIEGEEEKAKKFLKGAEEDEFLKIKIFYGNNRNKIEENLKNFDEYLDNESFSMHKKEVEKWKKEVHEKKSEVEYRNLVKTVNKYNKEMTYNNLQEVISDCNKFIKNKYSANRDNVSKIKKTAENIKRGINLEAELFISNKSSVFNGRKYYFDLTVGKLRLKKQKKLTSNKEMYIGSFYGSLKYNDKITLIVYSYDFSDNRKKLDSYTSTFDRLKKTITVKDKNDNEMFLEIRFIKENFEIRI